MSRARVPRDPLRCVAVLLLATAVAACSDDPGGNGPEGLTWPVAIRLTESTGLSGDPGLAALVSESGELFDGRADVDLDEDFASLEAWQVKNDPEGGAEAIRRVEESRARGGAALSIVGGASQAGRLVAVRPGRPLVVCARVKLLPGVEPDVLGSVLKVVECRRRENLDVDPLLSKGVGGPRGDWQRIAEGDDWDDFAQVILATRRTTSLLVRVDAAAAALKQGGEVQVDRIMIRAATVAEVARDLQRRLRRDAESRVQPVLGYQLGEELRSSFLSADGGELSIPLRPGPARLLRFGLGFPASGGLGHSRECVVRIELVEKRDGGSLFREEFRVPSPETVSTAWIEKTLQLPSLDEGALLVLRTEAVGQGRALLAFGSPVLIDQVQEGRPPNVILISIDTLRADRLGAHGGHHPEGVSPFLDRLASSSIVFEEAISQAAYTLPSHVSMLSGQYPTVHGVVGPTDRIDPQRTQLLAPLLARAGYYTGAHTGGGFLHHKNGFGAGFDTYGVSEPLSGGNLKRTLGWIRANRSIPFFLFFHTYAVHESAFDRADYLERFDPGCESKVHRLTSVRRQLDWMRAAEEYDEGDVRCLENRYAAGIRLTDEALRELVGCLEAEGMLSDTLLIITSDHGQELLDRGGIQHGLSLYEELVHVPLIVRLPGRPRSARRVDGPVQVIDVVPTVLDYLNLPLPQSIQGRSLKPFLGAGADDVAGSLAYAEVDYAIGGLNAMMCTVRTERWKLIRNFEPLGPLGKEYQEFEFYDLSSDPGENVNVAGESARFPEYLDRMERLRESLQREWDSPQGGKPEEGELDPAVLEQLKELGYVE